MKIVKRIILIVLLLLLSAGAMLLDPLVRFTLALHFERFTDADAVYAARIDGSVRLESEANRQLQRYVTHLLQQYYDKETPYDRARSILSG